MRELRAELAEFLEGHRCLACGGGLAGRDDVPVEGGGFVHAAPPAGSRSGVNAAPPCHTAGRDSRDPAVPLLNERQARFVAEYLLDLNATQAAIRAGYSAATASQIGARLLANVKVAAAIAEAQAARSRRTEVTADRVVLELARVAFGDPRRVMSWGPGGVRLRPSAELADEEAAIVAEVGVIAESVRNCPLSGKSDEQRSRVTEWRGTGRGLRWYRSSCNRR